jgi:hypothetical protein
LTGPSLLHKELLDPELHVGCEKLSLAATMDRLRGKQFSRSKIMEKYIAAYESWREEQGRGMEESEFEALKSNLDGSYWSK